MLTDSVVKSSQEPRCLTALLLSCIEPSSVFRRLTVKVLIGNQRTVTVAGARETVSSQVVQQTRIQCFNCKEYGHFAKECRKPKRTHKEKMLLYKQAEKGVPLQAEQADWLKDTYEEVDEQELEAHYIQHSEQPVSVNNTCVVEKVDSNDIPNSSDMCDNDNQADQNAEECDDEHRCTIALQNNEIELEKYKTYHDRTIEHEILESKLKDTREQLALKEHDIKEGLKIKAYEIFVVEEKHDELVKRSLLTKSSYESLVKEKNKVIKDLKLKEENNLDKLIAMKKQLDFLNEIVYKQKKSIQTIHMLAPKGSTYNGRPTFANPMYLKKAQSEKPCLYEISYEKCDLANLFAPDREETLTLEQESRSKLNKDKVKPYDYKKKNSLYEIFKPPSREYLDQLAHANEIHKKM
ncbi:retrovirus-related pol polyprotein from transposon TNT 1-94 [Tanacetum coccineum]